MGQLKIKNFTVECIQDIILMVFISTQHYIDTQLWNTVLHLSLHRQCLLVYI